MRDGHTEILVRIHRGIVDADFIVKDADPVERPLVPTYPITSPRWDSLPGCDGKTGKVAVAGADAVPVIDHDRPAVAAHLIAKCNRAVARSQKPGHRSCCRYRHRCEMLLRR